MNKYIKLIVLIIVLIFVLWWYKMNNNGYSWNERIEIPNIVIRDTIVYENKNAKFVFDRESAYKILKGIVEEESGMNETGVKVESRHKYLMKALELNKGKFKLNYLDKYTLKLDSTSLGNLKFLKGIDNIKMSDWDKDTIGYIKDFSDTRNFYVESIERIIPELIQRKEIRIDDIRNLESQKYIILNHHKSGINNYSATYRFEDGRYLCSKEAWLGL